MFDAIHGQILIPNYIYQIIDTEEFQRLRNLKQLGCSGQIFPGAIHTRFEHSIGVYHLSSVLMNNLEKNSNIKINEFHRKSVLIAALLHDIGHGPFSHLWEIFVFIASGNKCDHEKISCDIVNSIFNNYNITLFNDKNEQIRCVKLINLLITGNYEELKKMLGPDFIFLSEIVHNAYCEIDVDKWDYILRDSYYLNNVLSVDKTFVNFFAGARVTLGPDNYNHISYNECDYNLIFNLFKIRSDLHKYCYRNPLVTGFEQKICDIFYQAELNGFKIKGIKMSDAHQHLNVYKYLDDTILKIIYLNDDPNLKNVQNQIKSFYERKNYKKIWESEIRTDINLLKKILGDNFIEIEQIIKIEIPKNLLLHDVNGKLVQTKIEDKNETFKRYLIFCTSNSNHILNEAKKILTTIET